MLFPSDEWRKGVFDVTSAITVVVGAALLLLLLQMQ